MELGRKHSAPRLTWHLFGLPVILSLGAFFSWGTFAFWSHAKGDPMVAMTAGGYVTAVAIIEILAVYPETNRLRLVLTSHALVLLVVVFLISFFRLYYSRTFLSVFFIGSVAWTYLGLQVLFSSRKLRMGLMPGGLSEQLRRIKRADWIMLEKPDHSLEADAIVVDLHEKFSNEWVQFLAHCSLRRIPIRHAATTYEALTGRVSLDHLSEGLLEDFSVPLFYVRVLKPLIDRVVVVLSAPVIIPVCILVAIAIKLESPSGPVLFRQQRMGQGDTPFWMLKFRSMRTSAEREARFAEEGDSRLTRIGKVIRKLRLDELPQFWNVLRGDMSLIGPRPEQVPFVEQFEREIPFYGYRHLLKPGISGWAQVTHGYAACVDSTRKKLEYDLFYVRHISIKLDVLIVFKTLKALVTKFGAR